MYLSPGDSLSNCVPGLGQANTAPPNAGSEASFGRTGSGEYQPWMASQISLRSIGQTSSRSCQPVANWELLGPLVDKIDAVGFDEVEIVL